MKWTQGAGFPGTVTGPDLSYEGGAFELSLEVDEERSGLEMKGHLG